jgi:putative peptidoglycan lipid II flippase
MMSENAANNELNRLKDTLSFSLRAISFLILPAAVGLILLGNPIISLLFQRGQFLAKDTNATAWVLAFYALGLIFYAGVKVAASAFYSLQDTKTPVKIASAAMILNVILNICVVTIEPIKTYFGAGGLAFATSISSAFNFLLLIIIFRKRKGLIGGRKITSSIVKHIIASIIMGIGIHNVFMSIKFWPVYFSVPLSIAAGAFIYAAAGYVLAIPELKNIGEIFRIKFSSNEDR